MKDTKTEKDDVNVGTIKHRERRGSDVERKVSFLVDDEGKIVEEVIEDAGFVDGDVDLSDSHVVCRNDKVEYGASMIVVGENTQVET